MDGIAYAGTNMCLGKQYNKIELHSLISLPLWRHICHPDRGEIGPMFHENISGFRQIIWGTSVNKVIR